MNYTWKKMLFFRDEIVFSTECFKNALKLKSRNGDSGKTYKMAILSKNHHLSPREMILNKLMMHLFSIFFFCSHHQFLCEIKRKCKKIMHSLNKNAKWFWKFLLNIKTKLFYNNLKRKTCGKKKKTSQKIKFEYITHVYKILLKYSQSRHKKKTFCLLFFFVHIVLSKHHELCL